MARHVITEPAHQNRLREEPATRDGEDGEIAHTHGDGALTEQDHVAQRGDETPGQGEREAVSEPVAGVGRRQRDDHGDAVHGDAHHLRAHLRPTELVQDGWREERHRVAGVDDAEVHNWTIRRIISSMRFFWRLQLF